MGRHNNLKDAQAELMDQLNMTRIAVAIQVSNEIIVGSAVDTGRFRGNWQCSIGHRITDEIPAANSYGRREDPSITFNGSQLKDTLYLTNNLAYAEPLELGWSKQQPAGLVRTTVANGQQILDKKTKEISGGG